jgi:hypothetical protein
MAQKIPLNKFKSKYVVVSTALTPQIYTAESERATILLNVQATNITNVDQTISLFVSAGGNVTSPRDPYVEGNLFAVVSALPIPARDARSLVTGRLVLRGADTTYDIPDKLLIQASSPNSIHLSLGLLEAVNRD